MALAEWRQDETGFRYVVTDYRDATAEERYAVFRAGTQLAENAGHRVGVVVLAGDEGLDPSWFKEVKDHNSSIRDDLVRVALVGLGRRGTAIAGMLNVRLTHERARAFDDEASALEWLRSFDDAAEAVARLREA